MRSLHTGSTRLFGALLVTAVVALAVGCEAGVTGSTGSPAVAESPQGGPPPVVAASADVDDGLVYDPDGPADDIEGYPFVVYGGVNVYFVEGRWYRYGKAGWGYLRNEPPELTRQREMHERDARWGRAPEAAPRTAPERPGVAERQGADERAAPPGAKAPAGKAAPVGKKKAAARKVGPAHAAPGRAPIEKEERR